MRTLLKDIRESWHTGAGRFKLVRADRANDRSTLVVMVNMHNNLLRDGESSPEQAKAITELIVGDFEKRSRAMLERRLGLR